MSDKHRDSWASWVNFEGTSPAARAAFHHRELKEVADYLLAGLEGTLQRRQFSPALPTEITVAEEVFGRLAKALQEGWYEELCES